MDENILRLSEQIPESRKITHLSISHSDARDHRNCVRDRRSHDHHMLPHDSLRDGHILFQG